MNIIDWKRNGFENVIGATLSTQGTDSVSYAITNDNDDTLEIQITPSNGSIHLELNGAGGDEMYIYMDFFHAQRIRYVKYTYGPDIHYCIEIGPCTIIESGNDQIMLTIRTIPGFSVWTTDYNIFLDELETKKREVVE